MDHGDLIIVTAPSEEDPEKPDATEEEEKQAEPSKDNKVASTEQAELSKDEGNMLPSSSQIDKEDGDKQLQEDGSSRADAISSTQQASAEKTKDQEKLNEPAPKEKTNIRGSEQTEKEAERGHKEKKGSTKTKEEKKKAGGRSSRHRDDSEDDEPTKKKGRK